MLLFQLLLQFRSDNNQNGRKGVRHRVRCATNVMFIAWNWRKVSNEYWQMLTKGKGGKITWWGKSVRKWKDPISLSFYHMDLGYNNLETSRPTKEQMSLL